MLALDAGGSQGSHLCGAFLDIIYHFFVSYEQTKTSTSFEQTKTSASFELCIPQLTTH